MLIQVFLKSTEKKLKFIQLVELTLQSTQVTDVRSANWAGNELIVHLANGKARRYSYEGSYKTV